MMALPQQPKFTYMKREEVDRMLPRIFKEYNAACDLEEEQSKERWICGKHAFRPGMMSPEQTRANIDRMDVEAFDGELSYLASNLKEHTISRVRAEAILDHIDIFVERADKKRKEIAEKYTKDMATYRQAQIEANGKRGRDEDPEYVEIEVSERHKCGGKGQSHLATEKKRVRFADVELYR